MDRFAQAVMDGRYAHAKAAVPSCRAALEKLRKSSRDKQPLPVRGPEGTHAVLLKRARLLGRPRILVRWLDGERALLDRFAKAVADGRFRTAREAGWACQAAITELHRRYPVRYAGRPVRSIHTIQHDLWPRVARLRDRWFNSHWSDAELRLVDRYARAVITHKYPHIRAAARACGDAINLMHSRHMGRKVMVRTLSGVFDQILTRAYELGRFKLPHRRWTDEERRVAARWVRKYALHRRGKLRMNLFTVAGMLRDELERLGYYRTVTGCVAEIVTQHSRSLGRPPRRR